MEPHRRRSGTPSANKTVERPETAFGVLFRSRISLAFWALIFPLFMAAPLRADSAASAPFRIGFSTTLFTDVNENDANAAVKTWSKIVADESGFSVRPSTSIFSDVDSLRRALRAGGVDAVGMDLIQYDTLREEIRFDPLFFTFDQGAVTERYVLLAHRDGPVRTLADLRGRRLRIHRNVRTCLAPLWLDLVLADRGVGRAADVAAGIAWESQLSKVVLPVFFRQIDACVATRKGFDTMRELNPQVGRRLMVLVESPDLVGGVFAFRADFRSPFRKEIISSVDALNESVAGKQMLNLFQTDDLRRRPAALLDAALEMIDAHERLEAGTPRP
jgi:phosphonate transport system substrate-binding protein